MASAKDINSAKETYGSFTTMLKWGTITAFVVGLIVIFIIA